MIGKNKIVMGMKQLNKEPYRSLIKCHSLIYAFVLSLILFVIFLYSYFFNNYVLYTHINFFGEAHIELIVLIAMFIFISYGLYLSHKDTKRLIETYKNRINK